MMSIRPLLTDRLQIRAAAVDREQLGRRAQQDRAGAAIFAAGLVAAVALAAIIVLAGPKVGILMTAVAALLAAVAVRPAIAGYLLIGITPLVAGIDRGAALPVLRPHEALLILAGVALCGRAILAAKLTARPRRQLSRLDFAILLVAGTSSVVPLAWLALRGQPVEQDDILYSLMVWKYYAVFLIFRTAIRSSAQVRTCLWLSLAAAAVVAVLAILQSLERFGVGAFLAAHYAPYGNVTAVTNNRGGSTLGLPIAVADLLTFNLAIAFGLLTSSTRRLLLLALAALFVIGVFAAGEFSGLIALLVGAAAIAAGSRRGWYIAILPASVGPAAIMLQSVIDRRLEGFQSPSGLPLSWEGRLNNLENHFLPRLFSSEQWVLGVRPAARVADPTLATGYIWIESGYIWLLWAGGLPLLMAFFYFLWAAGREALAVLRMRADVAGAAALGALTALAVVGVLMIIDPHLTYRGSADLMFALLGVTAAARTMPIEASATR
jgi:hypothetical protein